MTKDKRPKTRNKEIRTVKVADIVPNPKNMRTHPDSQRRAFAGVVDSEAGWYGYPDVFEHPDHPGKLMLIDGELRLEYLRKEYGDDGEIEVNVTDHKPQEADTALLTHDPVAAMAKTNKDQLDKLLASVQPQDKRLDDLLRKLKSNATRTRLLDDESIDIQIRDARDEQLAKWKTKSGDVWEIVKTSRHLLHISDCTTEEAYEPFPKSVDLCFTSPPYNLGKSVQLNGSIIGKSGNAYDDYNDENAEWLELMKAFAERVRGVAAASVVNLQILAGNKRDFMEFLYAERSRLVDVVVWDKQCSPVPPSSSLLRSEFELLLIYAGENASRIVPFSGWHGQFSNVYHGPKNHENVAAYANAAAMPTHLVGFVVGDLCGECSSVLDPFAGTGTTMLVCDQLGKQSYNVELSPLQAAIALSRMADFGAKCKKL